MSSLHNLLTEDEIQRMRTQVQRFFARDTVLQSHIIHTRQSLYVADCSLCLAHNDSIAFHARITSNN